MTADPRPDPSDTGTRPDAAPVELPEPPEAKAGKAGKTGADAPKPETTPVVRRRSRTAASGSGHTPGSHVSSQSPAGEDTSEPGAPPASGIPAGPTPPDPAPDPDPVPPVPPPPPLDPVTPPPPRAGIARPLLGGALAAALGFGLAQVVPEGWPLGAPADRLAGLETRLAAQERALAETTLSDRLDALDARLAALPDPQADLAALRAEIADLRDRPSADPDALRAAAQAETEALRAELAALKAELARLPGEALAAEFEALKAAAESERTAAEARAETLRAEAEATARAGVARAAALRVQAALDSGAELAPLLDDLTAAGLSVPPDLATQAQGVATLTALQAEFPQAARAALASVAAPADHAGWGDRVTAFVKAQTGLRSLTPREGDDPDAVLSRAEARLAGGDLPGTFAELDRLPEPARAALADWRARAEARAAALRAVAGLIPQL